MSLVDRVKNILLAPAAEWPKIADEPATVQSIYSGYVMILAAIGPVAMAISSVGHGAGAGLGVAVASYVVGLAVTYLLAMIVDALAPTFGGEKNFVQSLKLTAYSYTAAWIAGIFQLVPAIGGFIGLAAAIYSFYTFYLGVPVLKKSPPGKAVVYTLVIVLCGIVLGMVLGVVLISIVGGNAMMMR
jgi:hypothetical protein